MPVMNIIHHDFEEPHVRFLPLKIWAYMLFPSAVAERDRFLSSALLETAAGFANAFNVGVVIAPSALGHLHQKSDVRAMGEAAVQPVIAGAATSPNAVERSSGELAGEMFLMAISHDLQEPNSVSLGSVLRYASDYFKESKKTRPADLKKVWHEHRPSAHLWAALLQWKELHQSSGEGDAPRLLPTDGKGLHLFLALAEVLRKKGEVIKAQASAGSRQGEDDVIVWNRQKLRLAFFEPLPRRRALALRAVAIAAGIVGDAFVRAVLAALDMSAERGGSTGLDRRHHLQLGVAHVTGVGLAPRRPMGPKNVGDLQARPRHAAPVRPAATRSRG